MTVARGIAMVTVREQGEDGRTCSSEQLPRETKTPSEQPHNPSAWPRVFHCAPRHIDTSEASNPAFWSSHIRKAWFMSNLVDVKPGGFLSLLSQWNLDGTTLPRKELVDAGWSDEERNLRRWKTFSTRRHQKPSRCPSCVQKRTRTRLPGSARSEVLKQR